MDRALNARDVVKQLRLPVGDITTLLALLSGPLDCLGLLPPSLRKYNVNPLSDDTTQVLRHIPTIQQTILQHIFPTWEAALARNSLTSILEQYFCPDSFSYALSSSGDVVLFAYSTILSISLSGYSIHLLERLTTEYPVDRLYKAIFSRGSNSKKDMLWEDCIRNFSAVPAKVANFAGTDSIPSSLAQGNYFNNLSVRCETLIFSLAVNGKHENDVSSIVSLLAKSVHIGLFPPNLPTLPSQASFFQATLPIIRSRLDDSANESCYSKFWAEVFLGFPSVLTLRTVLTSLFASLRTLDSPLDGSAYQRAWVKREALLLDRLVGRISLDNKELCETAIPIILGRNWDESCARIFVCWVAGPQERDADDNALGHFLQEIVNVWSSPDHVKHSLLARHQYFTALLVFTVSYLKRNSPEVSSLAQGGNFISGVSLYIGHMDASIRRCGMLAAEVVAHASGKKLNFEDWEGTGDGKPWTRALRALLYERDVDSNIVVLEKEPVPTKKTEEPGDAASIRKASPQSSMLRSNAGDYDSDDSLTGYASPASSRSVSPTPSELDNIEKDPTLNVTKKKISRPVYLVQLGELLRSSGGVQQSDAALEADRIELALSCSEDLIRRKQFFGTELEENAANLTYGLIALHNSYNLENFDTRRQNALVALVACCPRKTTPCIIEEFFKNQYNVGQRYVMLNALALGAREMSGLAHPPLPQYPSKLLPASLHRKYITGRDFGMTLLPVIMEDLTRQAIQSGKDSALASAPAVVRERRLRIQKPQMVAEVRKPEHLNETVPHSAVKFTEVAAEFFVGPLMNRFWLFLRDEQTREERTAHLKGRQVYYGAGTGLILNSLVLSYFLSTLGVLLHASRNAPEWSAVLGPDALELAVNIGTRPVSRIEDEEELDSGEGARNQEGGGPMGRQASVLQSSLELTLVILEGYQELDEGKSLCLEHTALLFGVIEWAGAVFSRLDKGERVKGGGGSSETGLQRAAAGVVLKADIITSKWRRSMISM
ncbi:uncharacterized protein BT62DRAFT_939781, partial [Guyanagaster necrorhizus]